MNRRCFRLAMVLACVGVGAGHGAEVSRSTVSLSGAWALYPLAVQWAEAYGKLHPEIEFDVSAGGAGKGMTDVLAGAVDIGMVSRDISQAELDRGAWAIPVAKDAVVAVVNVRNPVRDRLRERGLSREDARRLWVSGDVATWGELVGTAESSPIRVYTRSDACGAAETWARWLGTSSETLRGIGVYGDPGLGEAVRRDPLGIGFNNVNFAYDPHTGAPVAGLAVVPLDLNADGRLAPEEDFYASRDQLMAAIAEGRYPAPPARELYLVTKGPPSRPAVIAFLRWILSEGQNLVTASGYIRLPEERLAPSRAALEGDR